LVTEKLRGPVAAFAAIVKLAVKLVALVTVIKFTEISEPALTVVTPLIKFAPVKTTSSVCPRLPLAGAMPINAGAGLLTMNVWLAEVAPLLVTEKLRGPVAAFALMVRFAVKLVEFVTLVELTVMPEPALTVVTPLIKLAPIKSTSKVCRRLPVVGAMLPKVGPGSVTVKIRLPEVPPPGPVLVTEKLRGPVAALASIVKLAVRLVAFVTVIELTVMPAPTLTEVTLLIKFVPVKTTSKVCKRLPAAGERLVNAGLGLFTVNVTLPEVPPPEPVLVTEKFRDPVAALAPMVKFAVKLVELATVVELTVISSPALTEVTPLIKFVPIKTTSKVCKRLPAVGTMLLKVGAGSLMVKLRLFEVPPPGAILVTEKLRGPVAALTPIVKFAVKLVGLVIVIEFTVISEPASTLVVPLIKFVPVNTTFSVCKRLPVAGAIFVSAGSGLFTLKVRFPEAPPPGPVLVTEKLRAPVAALALIARFAFKVVELVTVAELTVIPAPALTEVTPLIKSVPVKTTSTVCRRLPLNGWIFVNVGAGLLTVKV